MTVSEKEFHELGALATQRCQDACNSVGNLLDDNEQALDLLLNVINSMCVNAATMMHDAVKKPDGTKPGYDECFCEILAMLARAQGYSAGAIEMDDDGRTIQ